MNNSLFDLNITKGVEKQKNDLSPQTASITRTTPAVSKRICATLTCGCNITGGK
ncbi:Lantibiotic epilancin precursor [Staphylococcus xylosus]|uniref:epilancin family lantibiotic n=1 Tax=Staphylococcus xylosus TaxID=1288 RepID=UPI00086D1A16|nr:lantibiotic paenibacillin [Staphylococcus xylosus]SCU36960.1 Lantibiotic epilancin precursor [Staphylococcus xylosus]